MSTSGPVIAVLGGTGALGAGLAKRWAQAGYPVIIGSRSGERAEQAAANMAEEVPEASIRGLEQAEASVAADIVVLSVPYENHRGTLEAVKPGVEGKILIDVTVPLRPPKVGRVQLPEAGSSAVEAQQFLGEGVRVVSAFQNIGAELIQSDAVIDCDVLVSGDDVPAREAVIELVEAAGMRGWHAGPIANSAAAEALTSVLIQINRRYKSSHAGIRIVGVPGEESEAAASGLRVMPVTGLPLVEPGDNIAGLILEGVARLGHGLEDGDIVVVAQKIVSKSEGRYVSLDTVNPTSRAQELARETNKDPRLVELVLSESADVVRYRKDVLIVAHRLGFVLANAGIDESNIESSDEDRRVLLLPEDPDRTARRLREALSAASGANVAVIIADTHGRPWRVGVVGQAIGIAGMGALTDYRDRKDIFGRDFVMTEQAIADEVASSASLVMGQGDERVPAAIVRGVEWQERETGLTPMLRAKAEDLFR